MESRYEILMDEYEKQINIEALTMLDIAKKDIWHRSEGYGCGTETCKGFEK